MTSWVAIDFETANALRASPCSVGLVKVRGGQIVEEWSSLIKPPDGHDHFDAFNVGIHGITADRVRGAPGWPETLERIVRFAGDAPLVAHNAAFDIGVLADTCRAISRPVPDLRFACTLVVARRTWTGLLSYKLPVLADVLDIELPHHHDAGDDARAAAQVMLAALNRKATATLNDLLAAHRIQMGSYRSGVRQGCTYRGAARREPFPDAEPNADPDNPLYGLTVCFTGSLPDMTRAVAAKRIAALGARTVPDVTKSVDLVVVGTIDPAGSSPERRRPGSSPRRSGSATPAVTSPSSTTKSSSSSSRWPRADQPMRRFTDLRSSPPMCRRPLDQPSPAQHQRAAAHPHATPIRWRAM